MGKVLGKGIWYSNCCRRVNEILRGISILRVPASPRLFIIPPTLFFAHPLPYLLTTPAKTVLTAALQSRNLSVLVPTNADVELYYTPDENAAKNILKLGLRNVGHTGTLQSEYWINASGQMSLSLWCLDESLYTKFAG